MCKVKQRGGIVGSSPPTSSPPVQRERERGLVIG
ncbi:hypothetical protein COLO4_08676 [Corchorus olitorius]|uniref:Uncharacterized protein n=1 Tax=Corchorus olitorius TaxID=93759 RepID=A0A1R3KEZ9_9ROSI|nr:hypothetical protein COLO4_08676 [Corchorus olitorius]